jgi:hypothetical protein
VRNVLMRVEYCRSITWASGRGLGSGNGSFLGPVKWHRAYRRVPLGALMSDVFLFHILLHIVPGGDDFVRGDGNICENEINI